MQDRFKFKGYWYNDVQKEWWVFDNPEFITGDGTAEIWSNSEDGAYPELPSDADLHLCQCTGLKDKNGKLIYEGDIVVGTSPRRLSNRPHEVKLYETTYGHYGYLFIEAEREPLVIGNRYQNPELLED